MLPSFQRTMCLPINQPCFGCLLSLYFSLSPSDTSFLSCKMQLISILVLCQTTCVLVSCQPADCDQTVVLIVISCLSSLNRWHATPSASFDFHNTSWLGQMAVAQSTHVKLLKGILAQEEERLCPLRTLQSQCPFQRSAKIVLFVGCCPPNCSSVPQLVSLFLICFQYHVQALYVRGQIVLYLIRNDIFAFYTIGSKHIHQTFAGQMTTRPL